ncbi:MAG: M20/M25/M40 family metallo-hydrolase [Desulfocapsaceae bacterium]|jgi:tripeptide aminopeptidase|nr:M20/M25/M40 family metallo-hydrolase [Desulfocapsaceae bacterium]
MNVTIDKERLAKTFTELCEISSPSRQEKGVADYLKTIFTGLGADYIHEDDSAAATGSLTGNLVFRFDGNSPAAPLFFACHMDTVQPGQGVQVKRSEDVFTSRGETILGGDDKSGIAPLIELFTLLRDHKIRHRTVELVFTTCEEIGLLGAKSFDYSQLQSRFGYALDSNGIDKVIIGAPASNRIRIDVHGTAAHAGMNPEGGVSAFLVAAEALTRLKLGRLDDESTANIGVMNGGTATNIIPEHLMLKGEVRSHSIDKLAAYTAEIEATFVKTAADWPVDDESKRPTVDFKVESDYPVMKLSKEDIVIRTVTAAGQTLGRNISLVIAGGGSDANIFNGYGLSTAIIATGMNKVHTTDECLDLNDMVSLTELLLAISTE